MKESPKSKLHAYCTVDPSQLEREGDKIICRKCSREMADLDAEDSGSGEASSTAAASRRLLCGVVSAVALGGCSTGKVAPEEEAPLLPGVRASESFYMGRMKAPETSNQEYPSATHIEGRPGMVVSPYGGHVVDVSRIPAGGLVIDPKFGAESGKFFRI